MATDDDQQSSPKGPPSKRTTTRKRPVRSQPDAKPASAESSADDDQQARRAHDGDGPSPRSKERHERPRLPAREIARRAAAELVELTGQEVEAVTGLDRQDHGWKVEAEVVELRRIPSTTDVLATYEIDVDPHGHLQGYRRTGRHARGDTRSEP